jgi:DinB family protein
VTDELAALADELAATRAEFLSALESLDPGRRDDPALIGDWGARELIAHLGYWAGHAVESIHAVETGRAEEFGADRPAVDEINATVARVARQADLATVRKREAASVEALFERLRAMDPSLLGTPLPHHGLTLGQGLREDGPAHYREHAADLRSAVEDR